MNMRQKYTYSATNVGGTTWMVRRTDENGQWTEALLNSSATEEEVIQQAIERGSWG